MIIVLAIVLLLFVALGILMRQPQFGRISSNHRLSKLEASPNYRKKQFHNINYTPQLTEGATMAMVMWQFLFNKDERNKPQDTIPSVKTNLKDLAPGNNVLVWFGHSSYYMQVAGKRILVDPVFSGYASPFSFTTKAFNGSNIYSAADMPEIDYLFISHDHYDHMDHKTLVQLVPKVKKVITGLGVGAHLEHWGYDVSNIIEKDWNEELILDDNLKVITATARHFSGRSFKRNGTIWLSFVLVSPNLKIYMGGDSGYDTHFTAIGSKYGPFDLAILENGQYNDAWKYIHMLPEEVVQAAKELKAKTLLPVHWGKFSLGLHAWDEPIKRVIKEARLQHQPAIHPMIGEVVDLQQMKEGNDWWEGIK